jgi:hypothetical protein
LTAGSAVTGGSVKSTAADVAVSGGSVDVVNIDANTSMTATAIAGNVALGTATVGGSMVIDARDVALLGAVNGKDQLITITASDAVISGSINAERIEIVDRSVGNPLRMATSPAETTPGIHGLG